MAKVIIFGDTIICPVYISVDGSKEIKIFGKKPCYIKVNAGTHCIAVTTISKWEQFLYSLNDSGGDWLSVWISSTTKKRISSANTSLAGDVDFDANEVLMLQVKQGITKKLISQKMMDISEAGKYVDLNAMVEAKKRVPWLKWAIVCLVFFIGLIGSFFGTTKKTGGDRSGNKTESTANSGEALSGRQYNSLVSDTQNTDSFIVKDAEGYQELYDYTIQESFTLDTDSTATLAVNAAEYILPDSDSRYLTRSDLKGFSKEECRLARNEIYARHGRKFDDASLTEYFSQFSWYHPTIEPDSFDDSMFNAMEIANRDLIVQYEKEQGYR